MIHLPMNVVKASDHCTLLSDFDIDLFRQGRHFMLYQHLGAHPVIFNGEPGIYFSVWAPGANFVSVIGGFNGWDKETHKMASRWDGSGIWELFIKDLVPGDLYKFHVRNRSGFSVDKADPFGFEMEEPPHTASRISVSNMKWEDSKWLKKRGVSDHKKKPLSIYEVHMGSWKRVPEAGDRWLTYRELADQLPDYCVDMGFTHVELMPVMEHPFYGSWGYQVTGYFAPTSRYGPVDDFKHLVNELHKKNIGVIIDWVPSHFPGDDHGLFKFDGTHLLEHADPREGFHPDWKSHIFNYGRNEVRSFLISSAIFWLDQFHIDGLRVDAVASMLYKDYSRSEGGWVPNHFGGRENLEAIHFLRELNLAIHTLQPGVFTLAEESTAWPGVTREVADGGLGFDYKWMMGWMHDSLQYFSKDPVYRSFHQQDLTFSMRYAFTEHFVLPLSHDEVVYGKGSLLRKMPGDDWQQAAHMRLLLGYMFGHPGAKLLFMGGEFGQSAEWRHDSSLDWHLLAQPFHLGIQQLVKDLNRVYTSEPACYSLNYTAEGFEWIDFMDQENSVFCWLRKSEDPGDYLVFLMNATPNVHVNYRIGVPEQTTFKEIMNTDQMKYGGSNVHNPGSIKAEASGMHGRSFSLALTLPPLALLILKPKRRRTGKT